MTALTAHTKSMNEYTRGLKAIQTATRAFGRSIVLRIEDGSFNEGCLTPSGKLFGAPEMLEPVLLIGYSGFSQKRQSAARKFLNANGLNTLAQK